MPDVIEEGLFDPPITNAVPEGDAILAAPSWRLAKSLAVLREEANILAPNRKKYNDGTIGDAAHAARASRHNPFGGVVTALDLTHDPEGGFDAHAIARELTTHPHPNLYYVISNRQAAYKKEGFVWRQYGGSHPHDKHIHVAVGWGPDNHPYDNLGQVDDTTPWNLGGGEIAPGQRDLKLTDPYMRGDDVKVLQQKLHDCLVADGGRDGAYGPGTRDGVVAMQQRLWPEHPEWHHGIVDANTWRDILKAETAAQYIDRVWLLPRRSLMAGDMFTRGFRDTYYLSLEFSLTICGMETSLGRPEDRLSQVYNWGCMRAFDPLKPWSQLANGKVTINNKEWWTFPTPWDGTYALGRLLKLEYADLYAQQGIASVAPKYYGESVPGYQAYLEQAIEMEAIFKAKLDTYKRGG